MANGLSLLGRGLGLPMSRMLKSEVYIWKDFRFFLTVI